MSDRPDAFQSVRRKSRKQHKCCECGSEIKRGDLYQYSSGVWNGEPSSFKQCVDCHELMELAAREARLNEEEFPCFGELRYYFENEMSIHWNGFAYVQDRSKELRCDENHLAKLLKIQPSHRA